MKLRWIARVSVVFSCLIILAGSSVPGSKIPHIFEFTPDKLIHCAEYFVLGLVIIFWVSQEFSIQKRYQLILLTIFIGSTFGIIDENYQRLTPGRTPDVWDWALDTLGVLFAAFFGNYLIKRFGTK